MWSAVANAAYTVIRLLGGRRLCRGVRSHDCGLWGIPGEGAVPPVMPQDGCCASMVGRAALHQQRTHDEFHQEYSPRLVGIL